jgi:hypothetical protein
MNWIDAVAYAVSGAIAALLVYPFLGKKKEHRVIYTIVSLVVLYVIHSILSVSTLPLVYGWQMDRELRKNPFYSQLAESSPQVYDKVKAAALEGMRKQEPQATTEAKIASLVAGAIPQYLPTASDESVIAFVKATTLELRELNGSNPDSCYFFMYPQKAPAPVANSINEEAKTRMLTAMGGVIASATHAPQAPPDKEESKALMLSVAGELEQKYGADMEILRREAKDTTERGKACTMAIDLYDRILSMPPRQASELLRYILSSQ